MIQSGYVPPWLPESDRQDGVVIDAIAHAALAHDLGDHEVVIDGIVGPWHLNRIRAAYGEVGRTLDYVVLQANEESALARVTTRRGQDDLDRQGVLNMHAAFRDMGAWQAHIVQTDDIEPSAVAASIVAIRASGKLGL